MNKLDIIVTNFNKILYYFLNILEYEAKLLKNNQVIKIVNEYKSILNVTLNSNKTLIISKTYVDIIRNDKLITSSNPNKIWNLNWMIFIKHKNDDLIIIKEFTKKISKKGINRLFSAGKALLKSSLNYAKYIHDK